MGKQFNEQDRGRLGGSGQRDRRVANHQAIRARGGNGTRSNMDGTGREGSINRGNKLAAKSRETKNALDGISNALSKNSKNWKPDTGNDWKWSSFNRMSQYKKEAPEVAGNIWGGAKNVGGYFKDGALDASEGLQTAKKDFRAIYDPNVDGPLELFNDDKIVDFDSELAKDDAWKIAAGLWGASNFMGFGGLGKALAVHGGKAIGKKAASEIAENTARAAAGRATATSDDAVARMANYAAPKTASNRAASVGGSSKPSQQLRPRPHYANSNASTAAMRSNDDYIRSLAEALANPRSARVATPRTADDVLFNYGGMGHATERAPLSAYGYQRMPKANEQTRLLFGEAPTDPEDYAQWAYESRGGYGF